MIIEQVPRFHWTPLPREGTAGVAARVMLNRAGVVIANLRFGANANIDEHFALFEIDVICLAGEGFISVGNDSSAFRAGDRVVWPVSVNHRLWTESSEMETLMVERHGS